MALPKGKEESGSPQQEGNLFSRLRRMVGGGSSLAVKAVETVSKEGAEEIDIGELIIGTEEKRAARLFTLLPTVITRLADVEGRLDERNVTKLKSQEEIKNFLEEIREDKTIFPDYNIKFFKLGVMEDQDEDIFITFQDRYPADGKEAKPFYKMRVDEGELKWVFNLAKQVNSGFENERYGRVKRAYDLLISEQEAK